jgi:hypothetical protein
MRTFMFGALAVLVVAAAGAASWTPREWATASTIELRTKCPGEAEHWFPVWVVVLDDQVYVRLGTRAANRIACNETSPYLGVRIGGQQFDRVQGVPVPGDAGRVAQAMAAKYWSDLIVHYMSHPLTLRLVPESTPGG